MCLLYRVISLIRTPPPSQDPAVALCLEIYGDPRGVGVSYERGGLAMLPFDLRRGSVCPAGVCRAYRKGRCRANMAHVRQSGPDSGLGIEVKVLDTVCVVACSLGSGTM